MRTFIDFLKGKKTYIVAIIGLLYGISQGDSEIVMTSLLAMTGRAAISKIQD